MHERPARPAPPPAHPFLLLHPSINPTPRLPPQRGRAYRPAAANRQHPNSAGGGGSSPRQPAKIVTPSRAVQSGASENYRTPLSDQTEPFQLGQHPIRRQRPHRGSIGRRIPSRQIAPPPEGSPGARNRRHQPLVNLDQAITPPVLRPLSPKPGDDIAGCQSNRIGAIIEYNSVFCFREKQPAFYNDPERSTCRANSGHDHPDRTTEKNCEKARNRR